MLKKITIVVVLFIALATLATIIILQPKKTTIKPADMLDENTLVFLSEENIGESIEFWKQSEFCKELFKIDIKSMMKANGGKKTDIEEFDKFIKEFNKYSLVIDQLFGNETTFAVQNMDFLKIFENIEDEKARFDILDAFIVISKPKTNTDLLKNLDTLFGEKYKSVPNEFDGRTIKTIPLEMNINISYVFSDGYLISAFSIDTIKECLKRIDNPKSATLAKNKNFINMQNNFEENWNSFFYFDFEKIVNPVIKNLVKKLETMPKFPQSQQNSIKMFENMYNGIYQMGSASYRKGKTISSKSIVTINQDEMNEMMKSTYSLPPKAMKTLEMIPENPILYSAMGIDLKAQIEMMTKSSGGHLEQMKPMYGMMLGVDFDELIDSFGNVCGVLLNDVKTDAIYPVPMLSLFIELKEKKVIEDCINQLLKVSLSSRSSNGASSSGMKLPNEEYNGVKATYFDLFPVIGIPIMPSFAFYNDSLIISSDLSLIKNMIDAKIKNENLLQSKMIEDKEECLAFGYINIEKGANTIHKAIEKYPQFTAVPNLKSNLDGIGIPILKALKSLKIGVQKTTVLKDKIISTFKLETL